LNHAAGKFNHAAGKLNHAAGKSKLYFIT
jgi:hypothetical protein